MVELYEENIEDWFMNKRDQISLTTHLCERVILKNDDKSIFNCFKNKFQFFKITNFKIKFNKF